MMQQTRASLEGAERDGHRERGELAFKAMSFRMENFAMPKEFEVH
jgi:hypothetical protein